MGEPLTNRERSKRPKQGKFWCWGCDRVLLTEGEKCRACGTRNYSNRKGRLKKPNKER